MAPVLAANLFVLHTRKNVTGECRDAKPAAQLQRSRTHASLLYSVSCCSGDVSCTCNDGKNWRQHAGNRGYLPYDRGDLHFVLALRLPLLLLCQGVVLHLCSTFVTTWALHTSSATVLSSAGRAAEVLDIDICIFNEWLHNATYHEITLFYLPN